MDCKSKQKGFPGAIRPLRRAVQKKDIPTGIVICGPGNTLPYFVALDGTMEMRDKRGVNCEICGSTPQEFDFICRIGYNTHNHILFS